ncbi:MATE family efflux transporter [Halomonas piscis]|uniref:Multidrug-efflux transporter n=1 Tax=Halomonas piscis TaxID=3031727 RepID=A0ABY9YX09_9GAMM|nr:MATE family efflux transporter [Halomonas piscis]WNK18880.1 MATE family efflux transporter [Halomonas piscis]
MTLLPPRRRRVMRLALPVMLGMLSQSVLNLIDAAMVGSLGEVALAGVGVGGYAMFMMTALVFGLSSAVQSQTARRLGEDAAAPAGPLNGGLLLAILMAAPLSLAAWWLAPALIGLMTPAPEVQAAGVSYFRWRVAALLAVAMTLCLRGYWNGRQQTGMYLRIILCVHAFNVLASLGLIFGLAGLPAMGAEGAGAGTALSLCLGLCLWLGVSFRGARAHGFLACLPTPGRFLRLAALVWPHSLQQLCFAAGYAVLFWMLGRVGTQSVAVGHILINLSLLLVLPGVGVGVAAMSLVGDALGRDARGDAHRWGLDALGLAWLLLATLALPMLAFPRPILGLFLHDAALIELGALPLRLTGAMIVLDAAALVLAQALMGAGAQRTVMTLTLSMQWLVFLPAAWGVGVAGGYGLLGIWLAQLGYRVLNSLGFLWIWQRRRWAIPEAEPA